MGTLSSHRVCTECIGQENDERGEEEGWEAALTNRGIEGWEEVIVEK